MRYFSTGKFLRTLQKYESPVRQDIARAIRLFEAGERESIGLHRLHGRMRAYHAFSANFSYRVVVKMTKKASYYIDVGTHDVYQ
ncbi:MAG TPA: hypothetical protein ENJ75_02755 [Candidatus Kaiserbacteria bacterium]|nr:hypothetical protein [Candidatus Kaiserbacteria bacterium]